MNEANTGLATLLEPKAKLPTSSKGKFRRRHRVPNFEASEALREWSEGLQATVAASVLHGGRFIVFCFSCHFFQRVVLSTKLESD